MNILNNIKKKIPDFPNVGTVVVHNDSESLLVKDLFFKLGRSVVSDRDVFTLEYELTRHISQTKGVRVLIDQIYPFIFEAGKKRDSAQSAINFIKNFPDPFVEPELASVLLEFLEQEESAQNLLQTFREALSLASRRQEFTEVPRGFANLYLDELNFDENTVVLNSVFKNMPIGFADKFENISIKISNEQIEWRDQIELFELFKNDSTIQFLDFEHQLEEVRSTLRILKNSKDPEKIRVFFPKNKGYEKLFYLYQREFFEEQIFALVKKEDETISRALSKISKELKKFITHYDFRGPLNKNKVTIHEVNPKLYKLQTLIDEFFEDDFTELDLGFTSDVLVQLGANKELPLADWKKILEQEKIKLNRKHEKINSKFKISDYDHVSHEELEEIVILGWSDSLFKKTGDKLFSSSIMSKLEINLGLFLPTLAKSEASVLFENPAMTNPNIKKKIFFSKQSFNGGSNKPGVFKILFEEKEKSKKDFVQRVLIDKPPIGKREQAHLKNKNLSASSLQRYDECPYKFYLEKVIGLEKEDDEDYFLSPKEEGSLMHKILEDLGDSDISKSSFDKKIRELILSEDSDFNLFRESAIKDLSQRMWYILNEERKHLLENEIVETLSEKFFRFNVDLSKKSFEQKGGDFSVRGLVDRIDIDKNQKALIYDYKRGESGTHSLAMYRGSKLAPQLFLYCLAADQGLLGNFQKFVGFQYINLSLYRRQKGFVLKKEAENIAREIPARSAVEEEKYQEKLDLFLKKFWQVLERISVENFNEAPNLAYSGQCSSCTWLGVCKKSETFV